MRLLDLFCGAGGAGVGYARAGFDVTGVDIEPHPDNPLPMIVADALDVLSDVEFCRSFDVIHASPPCQGYSSMTLSSARDRHPRLIAPVRDALQVIGRPYVIENVMGARSELRNPVMLCGSAFGLRVRRHRLFESSEWLWGQECDHDAQGVPVGVYGDHPDPVAHVRPNEGTSRGVRATSDAQARKALGIDWMNWRDLCESIPPAYTEYLGVQLLDAVRLAA